MHSVTRKVLDTITRYELLSSSDTVFVALSGGADSVSLLHILLELRQHLRLSSVRAVHVHHGIRGINADRDEAFVRQLCDSLGVPLEVYHVETLKEAAATHESVEEAARRLRYACFQKSVSDVSDAKIATAHTADDQVETVLLHLIRGSGLAGLTGIPFKREEIIRPLLDCTATEVRAFCTENGISFMTDETNASLAYSRNRVRHRILPEMKKINPGVAACLIRLSATAAEENAYLQEQAQQLLDEAQSGKRNYRIDILSKASPVICRRALIMAAQQNGASPERKHIVELHRCLARGGAVALPGFVTAQSDGKTLRFHKSERNRGDIEAECVPVIPGEELCFRGQRFECRCVTRDEYKKTLKIHKNVFNFSVSYDMIYRTVSLRSRKAGDGLRPYRRQCHKSLKKLFQEFSVPVMLRHTVPVLCDENGVLAVLGYAVDERAAVTDDTKMVLMILPVTTGDTNHL